MRRIKRLALALTATFLLWLPAVGRLIPAQADTANGPSLIISQLKITSSSGQFITLYNPGAVAVDMSKYQLEYFNHYDLSKATSSKLIALSGTVPPHGYFMVNDATLLLCYQLTVESVSLGLSSTAGWVGVVALTQSAAGGSVIPTLQDFVGWSKTAAAGAQTLPASTNAWLQRQPLDTGSNPTIVTAGGGSWQTVQADATDACKLVTVSSPSQPVVSGLNQLLPANEPPASIVELDTGASTDSVTPTLPTSDIGLMAPLLTELLPNPDGTGNDAVDEFIELYNPNTRPFDLSGFKLQTGLTTLRTYSFPAGSQLAPQSFTAFYTETTGLSLSNAGSLVKLLDPFDTAISAAEPYGTAKDGQAWALAKGHWYWTTTLTPNAANVIKQPVKKSNAGTTSKKTTAKPVTGAVKAAKTTKPTTLASGLQTQPPSTPVHIRTLALILGLALLYGAYEYRADLANRIYQLRSNLRARRANRRST